MARRKRKQIKAKELEIYPSLVEELSNRAEFAEYDMSTIRISLLKNIEPTIRNIDGVIARFERYLMMNQHYIETLLGEELINRQKMAKMLGISRPTLNDWIKKGFITPRKHSAHSDIETFSTSEVLEQLYRQKEIDNSKDK